MHEITLTIVDKNVTLSAHADNRGVAREEWVDDNNLLEEFFVRYEALLESKSFSSDFDPQTAKYSFSGDLSKGYTTMRIGKTIMSTLAFSHNIDKPV